MRGDNGRIGGTRYLPSIWQMEPDLSRCLYATPTHNPNVVAAFHSRPPATGFFSIRPAPLERLIVPQGTGVFIPSQFGRGVFIPPPATPSQAGTGVFIPQPATPSHSGTSRNQRLSDDDGVATKQRTETS